MKKSMFLATVVILFSAALYASTGIADITPEKIARGSASETIEINYYPYPASSWDKGSLTLIIPEEFFDMPSLTSGARGELKVYYLRGGVTIEPVLNSNILIDGRAVTITAINLMPNDFLKIVYGTKENGGGGVQAPYAPGTYYFLMQEKPADASAFTPLDSQPSIEVMMIELTKSANVTSIMAKNTFTFTLTYKNISNMYPVNEVRIWDTLPPGLNFIGANITPAAQTEDYLSWNLGTLYYNMSGSLQIAVEAQPGIIEYGQKLTNTAKMEASDGYGTYREEAEISVNVLGVKLVSDLIAIPSSVVLDGYVTVLMNVLNQGNYSAYNVSPTALTIYGDGKVINVSGPLPASVSMLEQGMETNFTWIYKATGAGPVYFNGRALGQENYMVVESYATYSNTVGITIPTNTNTPVISFTSTPMHTKTFTKTQTPSSTETQQIAATPTFTITMTLEFTPTFTETSKPVIITPTSVKTMVPTPTPDAFVYVDRNYFNPEKGETVKINYKVSEQGIVDVKIHNLSGEMIFSYSKNYPYATYDYLYWDGKNSAGKTAGRGIYFIVVKQKSQTVIKKIVIMK